MAIQAPSTHLHSTYHGERGVGEGQKKGLSVLFQEDVVKVPHNAATPCYKECEICSLFQEAMCKNKIWHPVASN